MAAMLEFRRRADVVSRAEDLRHARHSVRPAADRRRHHGAGAGGLPVASGAHDRSVGARRRHRHQRADPGRAPVASHGPAVRDREQAGRRADDWHRTGGTLAERRLHAAGRGGRDHHPARDQPEREVRYPARLRAGQSAYLLAKHAGDSRQAALQLAAGFHRRGESEARRIQLRLSRPRHAAAHGDGIVPRHGRARHAAHPLQGNCAGPERRHRRPGFLDHHQPAVGKIADRRRQCARPRNFQRDPLRHHAGPARHCRSGAGLRSDPVVRTVRARGYSRADRGAAA